MADPRAPLERFGKYGYLALSTHEIIRSGGSEGKSQHHSSLPPSVLAPRGEQKPWLVDALPRRFADGLPLAAGIVEGVLAREGGGQDLQGGGAAGAAAGAAALEPSRPFTAPRRKQRLYETPQAGGCLCGAVRFAVNAAKEPQLVVACHCRFCQKSSCAPFLVWATIEADDYLLLQGTPASFVQDGGVRRFCGFCGTPLSFSRTDLPDELDVALGSFDAPIWEVEMNIWAEHRVPPQDVEGLPSWQQDPARLLKHGQQET